MGIFPPDPTVRGLNCQPDSHRESLTSLVHEMQKCLAHSPHFQTPKKITVMCQKKPSHRSLGSRSTSAVQSFKNADLEQSVALSPARPNRSYASIQAIACISYYDYRRRVPMGVLLERKTQVIFVTASSVEQNGKAREVIVESRPQYA